MDQSNHAAAIGAAVIILNTKGEVLLGERINSYKAGWFGMPGGRIELEEPILDAAKREIQEETGLDIAYLEYVGVVRELQDGYNFIHFGYVTKEVTDEPQLIEADKCKGWKWYALDALPENILPGHKAVIDMYTKKETLVDLV